MSPISRRLFVTALGASGALLYLDRSAPFALGLQQNSSSFLKQHGPIDRTNLENGALDWSGDDFTRPHKILWDKASYIAALPGGKLPAPTEKVKLAIIGGGISGLTSAYLLRDQSPLVLEQAPRFGGNAKGESWGGLDYAIGAAYFVVPEAGSDIDSLVRELGLHKKWRVKTESEASTLIQGKHFSDFWDGQSAPEAKKEFQEFSKYLLDMNNGENGLQFPDIPIEDTSMRGYINDLDRISFRDYLIARSSKSALHSHIESALEYYCWSSFAASASEVSAAAGLNFLCSEFGEIAVLPGGNAAVAESLLSKIVQVVPTRNLRPSSLVFDVRVTDTGVYIAYEDIQGAVTVVEAENLIMSCPKFVALKLLNDIEPERETAIRQLQYRSYLVANVLLEGAPKKSFYDLFLLGDGQLQSGDSRSRSLSKGVTDVILANFAQKNSKRSVLSLYRAFPYNGARAEIFVPNSIDRFRGEFIQQIEKEILPALGYASKQMKGVRLTRWGHPLPVAATGLISDNVVDELQKPFRERVFFVEQDNWALPAFETSVTEAFTFEKLIRKRLS